MPANSIEPARKSSRAWTTSYATRRCIARLSRIRSGKRVITAIRLGAEPIASLALQGARMPDSVLQGIANLIAIGLERARAQNLAHQVEAARESEQLRTTLIDAMAHEFKTPLTSIKAATTSLLSNPEQPAENRDGTAQDRRRGSGAPARID